jgi:hypothetical protein
MFHNVCQIIEKNELRGIWGILLIELAYSWNNNLKNVSQDVNNFKTVCFHNLSRGTGHHQTEICQMAKINRQH